MNKETERRYESTFIPCGDALEKMDEIDDTISVDEQEKKDAENPEVSG